ncbi:outer membrane beta-barrel protein [Dinghuibacter silviterrae]|uniref:Outer membrane protein with beta-barrel domain n=1 Tax=Dinghuibacter silviterrae TaxID=1539049 RepID=A0A4R8DP81_9BACT|nr:outer membrane beta-barrel protein [Dinghuibacter silviterrae]TDW99873.1 outer membrane protein with beta-barrel domain [Dinghuibacter silviterrae]
MRDELFDHLKHKLAETEVPDPETGWQRMRALLDATVRPRPVYQLRRWYAAAACLILAGAAWALIHEAHSSKTKTPLAVTTGSGSRAGAGGQTSVAQADGAKAGGAQAAGAQTSGAQAGGAQAAGAQNGGVQAGGVPAGGVPATAQNDGAYPSGEPSRDLATTTGTTGSRRDDRFPAGSLTGSRASDKGSRQILANSDKETLLSQTKPQDVLVLETSGNPGSACFCTTTTRGYSGATPDLKMPFLEKPLAASPRLLASTGAPAGPIRPAHHSRWGFDVGLGANFPGSMRTVTVNNQSKWEPGLYPVFITRYRLTPKLSLKAGVAGPSPVAYTKTLSQKNLTVMDSTVQAYAALPASTSSTKIGRLLYLDVPVSVEWAVVRHLNVEAGIQYSRLLSEQDDTRTTITPLTNLALYYVSNTATNQDQQQPQVKTSDIRYLVGANYTWHRFSATVQYQRGLQHSANQVDDQGNSIVNRTSIAKMQIMYTLR